MHGVARSVCVVGLLIGVGVGVAEAAPKAVAPPLIDQAIKDAAEVGHPLVIELYAPWCRPCRWFETKVLARPEVQAAITAVDFLRYDIETPEGEAVARRYHTTAVPSFLILDGNGAAVERIAGLQGRGVRASDAEDQVAAWFVELLTSARTHTDELTALRDAAAAAPRDAEAWLAIAHYYRRSAMRAQAVAAYRVVVDAEPPMSGAAVAIAQGELDDLQAADRRVDDAVKTAMAFATRYPGSTLTTGRLALCATSGRVSAQEIEQQLRRHVEAVVPGADLAEAIRLALALRMRELVVAGLTRWQREFPNAALLDLVRVERDLFDGKHDAAAARLKRACAAPTPGTELQCYVLRAAVRETWRGAPGVRRIVSTAAEVVHGLEVPGEGDRGGANGTEIDALAAVDVALGNAVARSLRLAEVACGKRAEGAGQIQVAVRLASDAGTPRAVDTVIVGNTGATAQRCVERVVAAEALPRAAIDTGDTLYGRVDFEPDWRNVRHISPRPPAATLGAFARTGDVTSLGVAAHGVVGFGTLADFRSMLDAEAELGMHDSGVMGAARAMVGLGIGSDRWQFSALMGVGVSTADQSLPVAAELPFELRIDGPVGAGRVRLWARGAWLVGSEARQRDQGSALFSADETAIGLAVAASRIYFGAVTEERAAGTSTMFVIGTAFGQGL